MSGETPAVPAPLAGKYQLIRRIGAGGMAEVFLAQQTGIDGFEKLVVIKRVLPHFSDERHFVRLFLDEARTAADLRHPNIVQIYDVGEADGSYFLCMEYLNGENLRAVQKKLNGSAMPVPLVLQVIHQVAEALHYAHTKTDLKGRPLGIVHRDVSPQNIIATFEGVPKLVDFGIAKATSKTTHTAPGMVMGKVGYMSPEQAFGKTLDGRSDQFALGTVLYELSTGAPLFSKATDAATLQAITSGEVEPPRNVVSEYPKGLEEIVLRMLALDPADRFDDCGEVAAAIEDFMAEAHLVASRRKLAQYMRGLFPGSGDIPQGRSTKQKTAAMPARGEGKVMPTPTSATIPSVPAMPDAPSSPSLVAAPKPKPPEPEPPPRSRIGLWISLGVVAIAVVVAAVWQPWSSVGPQPTPTPIAAESLVPSPTPEAALSPTATPTPEKVVVTVTVKPTPRPTPVVARYGKLDVTARGGWVAVWVDGKKVDPETPLLGHRLKAGTHTIKVQNPPAQLTLTKKVTIQPGQTTKVVVDVPGRTIR